MSKEFRNFLSDSDDPSIELDSLRKHIASIVSAVPDVIWSVAIPTREVLYVSPACTHVFGHTPDEIYRQGMAWGDIVHPDDRERVMREWDSATGADVFESIYRIRRPDGVVRWIHARGKASRATNRRVSRMDGISRDITEQRDQERRIAQLVRLRTVLSKINSTILQVRDANELLKATCQVAVDDGEFGMVWAGTVDAENDVLRTVAHHGFGDDIPAEYSLKHIRSELPTLLVSGALLSQVPYFVNDITTAGSTNPLREIAVESGYRSGAALPLMIQNLCVGVIVMYAKDSEFFSGEEPALMNDLCRDLSAALENIARQERLNYLTQFDTLTGLPNRSSFLERLGQQMTEARGLDQRIGLAVGEMRRFRQVNEAFGRPAGDAVLRKFGERMQRMWPEPKSVARLTGDSFAGALAERETAAEYLSRLDQITSSLGLDPFPVDEKEIHIATAWGLAVFPDDGEDVETLFRNAEAALKKAVATGERIVQYQPEINQRVLDNVMMESQLRKALKAQQFSIAYQPKITTSSGAVCGYEALLRWRSPTGGSISPNVFVPILESSGMILDVGSWVILQALQDSRGWRSSPTEKAPRIAVNVSAMQLQQRDFVEIVEEAIVADGELSRLELEITESLIMHDLESNVKKLAAINEMGVRIAIDDFGTGHSSLAYLARLPVHTVKIDRSFIRTMLHNSHSMTIVSTIVSMAHAMGLEVIAEGVETEAQEDFLRHLGCDQVQGFLYSVPIAAHAAKAFWLQSSATIDSR